MKGIDGMVLISWGDLVWVARRSKRRILLIAASSFLLAFGAVCLCGVRYEAVAIFQEKKERGVNEGGAMKGLMLMYGMAPPQGETPAYLRSRPVMGRAISTLGLQLAVDSPGGLLGKVQRRVVDVLRAECRLPLAQRAWFSFAEVDYPGLFPARYELLFSAPDTFSLQSHGKTVGEGKVGQPFRSPQLSFTVTATPPELAIGRPYTLRATPLPDALADCRKALTIRPYEKNPLLHTLRYPDREPERALAVIEELISAYQRHLQDEFHHVAKEQLALLAKRQDDLFSQLYESLEEHAVAQQENLRAGGLLITDDPQSAFAPYVSLSSRLLGLDLQISSLEQGVGAPPLEPSPLFNELQGLRDELAKLSSQRDILHAALLQEPTPSDLPSSAEDDAADPQPTVESRSVYLQRLMGEIRSEKASLMELVERYRSGEEVSLDPPLASWAAALRRDEALAFFDNRLRLFSVREKIVQERLLAGHALPPELEGIDLDTARSLFARYNKELDAAYASTQNLERLMREMEHPTFDLTALGPILTDRVSADLISHAARLSLSLKDTAHYTAKEVQREKEELELDRRLLKEHVAQLCRMEQITLDLARQKMRASQQVILDGLNQSIAALQARLEEACRQGIAALKREKQVVAEQLSQVIEKMGSLPEEWKREKVIDFKTKMGQAVFRVVAEMAEEKTLAAHLHRIDSKPLDRPFLPAKPLPPHLSLFSCGAALGASLLALFSSFFAAVYRGLPASADKLRALGFSPLSPLLGTAPDSRERLSPIAATLSPGSILLLGKIGARADFAAPLARLLAQSGKQVHLISCHEGGKGAGLLDYLSGKADPLPSTLRGHIRYTPLGGGPQDLLLSDQFRHLLASPPAPYTLFLLPVDPQAGEALFALAAVKQVVMALHEESIEQLTPLTSWAYADPERRLLFLPVEET
jgi:hypothetical protein